MNYTIDILIVLCLAWGAFKGFGKGFIIQSFAIIALILGIWGGFSLSGSVEPFLVKHFNMGETTRYVISFVIVFLSVLVLVYVSGYLFSKVADAVTLGLINRLAGAVFGILANALVLSVIIILVDKVNTTKQFIPKDKLEKTYLYHPIKKIAPAIFPEKFFAKVKDTLTP